MDTLTHILNGFSVALQPINLWYTFLGCFLDREAVQYVGQRIHLQPT